MPRGCPAPSCSSYSCRTPNKNAGAINGEALVAEVRAAYLDSVTSAALKFRQGDERVETETKVETARPPASVEKYFTMVESAAAIAGAAGVALIAIATAVGIAARKAGLPSLGILELVASLMIIVSFLPLAAAQNEGQIRMTLVVDRLSGKVKLVFAYIEYTLALALSAILLWKGTALTLGSIAIREGTEGTVSYPLWIIKISIPLGMLLLVVRIVVQIYHLSPISRRRGNA